LLREAGQLLAGGTGQKHFIPGDNGTEVVAPSGVVPTPSATEQKPPRIATGK